MSQALEKSPVSESDRLSFTVLMAVLFHVALILGLGFEYLSEPSEPITNMEVIFIQNPNPQELEEADYLAQVSQSGSGNTEERVRPTAPPPSELPSESEQALQQIEMMPKKQPQPVEEVMTQETLDQAEIKQVKEITPEEDAMEGLTAEVLIQRSKEIASLTAEVDQQWKAYANQPRKKYISASTKEYTAAAYMSAWQQKVEKVGNINYPEAARRQNLYGSLLLDVAINPDGSVSDIKIIKGSGKPVLNDAAIRIVRLAAPFAPFPAKIKEETDVLHIIRTWEFGRTGLATR